MSLKRGEAAADAAREDFATVSQRVLREVDRFKKEKGDEMKRVVFDYVNAQIEYNRKMEQLWSNLLPQLENLALSSGSGGASPTSPGNGSNAVPSNGGGQQQAQSQQQTTTNEETLGSAPSSNQQNMDSNGIYQEQQQQQMMMSNNDLMSGSIQYRDLNNVPVYSNVPSS